MKKITNTLLLLLLPTFFLFGQNAERGTIETFDGDIVTIYQYPPNKKRSLKLKKGCDCALDKIQFKYYDEAGKLRKMSQRDIKKVMLQEGTNLCKNISKTGSSDFPMTMETKLEQAMILIGLPARKKGKSIMLQTIMASNDDYMLTYLPNGTDGAFVYLFKKDDDNYIEGGVDYLSVGYNGRGQKMYNYIKKYFKGCDNIFDQIEENRKYNKSAKRLQKLPLLQGVWNIEC